MCVGGLMAVIPEKSLSVNVGINVVGVKKTPMRKREIKVSE